MRINDLQTILEQINNESTYKLKDIAEFRYDFNSFQFFMELITCDHEIVETLHKQCKAYVFELSETLSPRNHETSFLKFENISFNFDDNEYIQDFFDEIRSISKDDPNALLYKKIRFILEVGYGLQRFLDQKSVSSQTYHSAIDAFENFNQKEIESIPEMQYLFLQLREKKQYDYMKTIKEGIDTFIAIAYGDDFTETPFNAVIQIMDSVCIQLNEMKERFEELGINALALELFIAEWNGYNEMSFKKITELGLNTNLSMTQIEVEINKINAKKALENKIEPFVLFKNLCENFSISLPELKANKYDLASLIEQLQVVSSYNASLLKLSNLTQNIVDQGRRAALIGFLEGTYTPDLEPVDEKQESENSQSSTSSCSSSFYSRPALTFDWRTLHPKGKDPEPEPAENDTLQFSPYVR